jgi:hypothetical protein
MGLAGGSHRTSTGGSGETYHHEATSGTGGTCGAHDSSRTNSPDLADASCAISAAKRSPRPGKAGPTDAGAPSPCAAHRDTTTPTTARQADRRPPDRPHCHPAPGPGPGPGPTNGPTVGAA